MAYNFCFEPPRPAPERSRTSLIDRNLIQLIRFSSQALPGFRRNTDWAKEASEIKSLLAKNQKTNVNNLQKGLGLIRACGRTIPHLVILPAFVCGARPPSTQCIARGLTIGLLAPNTAAFKRSAGVDLLTWLGFCTHSHILQSICRFINGLA